MSFALISREKNKCQGCGAPSFNEVIGFICPDCGKEFCGQCFEIDEEGEGDTFKCPGCGKILHIPQHSFPVPQ